MKKPIIAAFCTAFLLSLSASPMGAFADDITEPYIPDDITVDSTIPDKIVDSSSNTNYILAEICDALRKNVLDSDTVYVARREGLVIHHLQIEPVPRGRV